MLIQLLFSLVLTILIIKFIIFAVKHAIKRSQLSVFPQSRTAFLIGETSFFKKKPINHHFLQVLREIGSDYVSKDKIFLLWITIIPVVFMFNRDYIKKILSKNEEHILGKALFVYKSLDDTAPNSLLSVTANKWRPRRKLLSAPFHTSNLDNFVKIVNLESGRLVNYLKKNPCKDLNHEMKKLSMITISKLLFEYDLSDEIDEVVKLIDKSTDVLSRKAFSIFLISSFLYRFTSLAVEEGKLFKKMMSFKNRMLNAKTNLKEDLQHKLKSQNQDLYGKKNNLSLIEILLMNLKDADGEKTNEFSGFEIEEVRAQLDTFIIAGFDTQSAALTFLFYYLAKYQNYQQSIYEEIIQICGNDPNHELKLEEVKSFTLLEAFIAETLRIQPIIPIIARTVSKDLKLDDKYIIPAETDIVIFIEAVLKDPDYFPDPFTFKPERFLGEDQKDNLYINIPFSAGPRNCVAKRIALQLLSFASANLLRNFRIKFAASTPNELDTKFELVNKPTETIELKFVQRSNS